jgi:hypothetical protein
MERERRESQAHLFSLLKLLFMLPQPLPCHGLYFFYTETPNKNAAKGYPPSKKQQL